MSVEVPAISRKMVPPHWFAVVLALEIALHALAPVRQLLPHPWSYLGLLVSVAGFLLTLAAFGLFRRKQTGIRPFSDSTALVVEGPYRYTRNPMYLGMTLALFGIALALGSATPLLGPPLFMVIITLLFIRYEERQMEETHGEPYRALKQRVRRWL